MVEAERFQYLLSEIQRIIGIYEKLGFKKQDEFNIFSVLHKEHDEVRLHSRFLGELLDPKGSHNQAEKFLEIFFRRVLHETNLMELQFATVEREKLNIDLYVSSLDFKVIIENKIYADDRPQQLQEYFDRIRNGGVPPDRIKVVYLTLHGTAPNDNVFFDGEEHEVICLSYAVEIKKWLEECLKEVPLLPHIREAISQYHKLILKLTHQDQPEGLTMDIERILEKPENFKAMVDALPAYETVVKSVEIKFWADLKESLEKDGCACDFVDYGFSEINIQDYSGKKNDFGIRTKVFEIDEVNSVYIYIPYESGRVYYGVSGAIDHKRVAIKDDGPFKSVRMPQDYRGVSKWWICWQDTNPPVQLRDYSSPQFLELFDQEKRRELTRNISIGVQEMIKDCRIANGHQV